MASSDAIGTLRSLFSYQAQGHLMDVMQICSSLWLLLWLVWIVAWLRTKQTQECASFGSRMLYGIPVVIAFYLLFSEHMPFAWLQWRMYPRNPWIEGLAVLLTAGGIAF